MFTTLTSTLRRHPTRTGLAALVLALAAAFALYWFAPWNLFVDRRVDESLPAAAGVTEPEAAGAAAGSTGAPADTDEAPDASAGGVWTLASGAFRGLEHATAGMALVVELEDGSRFVRLQELDTSNGPDLRVVLTDQPVSDDWHVWDDGAIVDLGALKGNLGNSNYQVPGGVDLERFQTVVIWCRRFSVGFGVAPIGTV